jgi:hypothetical protein
VSIPLSQAIRQVILPNLDMPTPDVISGVKARGVKANENSIQNALYNVRSEMKRKALAAPPQAANDRAADEFSSALATIAMVNELVKALGGLEQARKVATVIEGCGGLEKFGKALGVLEKVRAS